MPTLKELENTDELYNPYNQRAASLAQQERQTGEDAGVNAGINQLEKYANDPANSTKNIDAANQAEQVKQGLWAGTGNSTTKAKLSLRDNIRKKGPLGGIISLIIGIPTIISILLSPALVIQQFSEALTSEFNDQLAAIDARSALLLKKKYSSTFTSGACGTVTIRCKYQSIRENSGLAKRLNNAGVEIEGNRSIIPGRVKPTHFVFEGKRIPADQLLNEAKTNPGLRSALRKGYDPLYAAFSDRKSASIRTRLGLKRSSSVESSTDKKKMNEDLKATAGGEKDLPPGGRLKALDDEGNPTSDDKATKYVDDLGNEYSPDEGRRLNSLFDVSAGREKLASKVSKAAISSSVKGVLTTTALGAGAVDSACTAWNLIRIAGFAAKYYQQRQLISYGYEFLKIAHKQKAGDLTAEEMEFFSTKLTTVNNEGKGALDSDGYKFAAYGDVFKPGTFDTSNIKDANDVDKKTEKIMLQNETSRYINGQLVSSSIMAQVAGMITNSKSSAVSQADKVCKFTKSWAGQAIVVGLAIAGAAVAILTGGGSVGAGAIAQGAVSVTVSVAFALLQPKLIDMAKGEVIKGDENGNETGNAVASGIGAYNAQTAQGRGLGVATEDTYTAYSQLSNQVAANYAAEDRASRSPFDPTSSNTFVGSILANTAPYLAKMSTLGSTGLSLSSFISSTFSVATKTQSAYAASDKYSQCEDPEYTSRNLAADPFCNLRYAIPVSDLKIDPEVVLDYMIDGGYITAEDETPQGDYADYVALCFERKSSIGDKFTNFTDGETEGGGNAGDECIIGEGGSNEYRNKMFRLFYIDTSVNEGMEEDFDTDIKQEESADDTEDLTLRVATFNAGGNPKPNEDMIQKMAEALEKNQPNIVGFQEFNDGWSKAALDSSRVEVSYAMFPEKGSVNAIVYNKDDFDLVKGGMMPDLKYFNGAKLEAPYALLRHKNSGAEIYVLNTHDPAKSENANLRLQNARQHVKFIKSLDKGIPIIFTGDFNSGYSLRSEGNITAGNNPENLTYCILTKNTNLNDAFDLVNNRPKRCPNPGNENTVDHIYLSDGITVDDYFRDYGGDVHDSHYADITIEGPGESGDITWPLDKKWWIQARADFLDAHGGAGTFTSPNTDKIAVDIGTPPDRTAIYAMAGGKVIKRPLGRSSRTCVGTPNPDNNGGLMIESNIQGGKLLVAYAHGQAVTNKDTVEAGEQIMELGNVGNSCGGHLHLDMSFNNKNVCPQDVFLALDKGDPINFAQLADKAGSSCGR